MAGAPLPSRIRQPEVTQLLHHVERGDPAATAKLLPIVYDELRLIAEQHFRRQSPNHTLQPTALVHEAFLKLVDQTQAQWNDRAHFFAVAATAMRHILVNHALAKQAEKRGGKRKRVELSDAGAAVAAQDLDMVALDEALKKLATVDERKHKVVELRFFAGLSVDEVAAVLKVSTTTVESDWRAARAWLNLELTRGT
jgi:RNA polymerase sigma factor (TIGR02999 family)